MKNENQPQHTGELLREGRTLYILHETGKFHKGEKEICNKLYFNIQPDYAHGITDKDAEEYAVKILKAINMHDELIEALSKLTNPFGCSMEDRVAAKQLLKQAEQK